MRAGGIGMVDTMNASAAYGVGSIVRRWIDLNSKAYGVSNSVAEVRKGAAAGRCGDGGAPGLHARP